MVAAGKVHDPFRRTSCGEQRGSLFAMDKRAGDGPTELEPRFVGGSGPGAAGVRQDDERHAVHGPLVALSYVVEKGRLEQGGIVVTSLAEPAGRRNGMDDVTGMLLFEECP